MIRPVLSSAAAIAALSVASTSTAEVDLMAPVDGVVEMLGSESILTFDLAELDPAEPVTISLSIITLAEDGALTEQFNLVVVSAAVDGNGDGVFGDSPMTDGNGAETGVRLDLDFVVGIDLALSAIEDFVDNGDAATAALRVVASTPSGRSVMSTIDATGGVPNEEDDTAWAFTTRRPRLVDVGLAPNRGAVVLSFDRRLSLTLDGAGPNSANQTQLADISGADFEVAPDGAFTNAAALIGVRNPEFLGDRRRLKLELDGMLTNAELGSHLRPANKDVTDYLGYEIDAENPQTEIGPLADLAGDDDIVGAADLAALLGDWSQGDTPSDLNFDGVVDAFDLAILLGSWNAGD